MIITIDYEVTERSGATPRFEDVVAEYFEKHQTIEMAFRDPSLGRVLCVDLRAVAARPDSVTA